MTDLISRTFIISLILLCTPCLGTAHAITLVKDTVWQGEVKVSEDLLVPKGVTLTVRPGTIVKVVAAESTKTDPEYLSPLTEITVRGRLVVEGDKKSPVEFAGEENRAGSWGGIILDQGTADLRFIRIRNAETAIYALDGKLKMEGATLEENRYGLVAQGKKAEVTAKDSRISGNDYGLFTLQGARFIPDATHVTGNRKRDNYTAAAKEFSAATKPAPTLEIPVGRRYMDEAFRGDTVWQGRIEVDGMIRVPQGSRLVIMPGTIIEFLKKDTNGDGIGENGILIQGRLVAKGTKEQPIIFRSAEAGKQMGDWDSINIMDSSGAQNLVEHCRIENAYRGLHFHFSNVAVHDSDLSGNYRGIQFQESLVDLSGNYFHGNKSAVQGRDSDLIFNDNIVHNNYTGANFYRTTLAARGNKIVGNWREGWRIREGVSTLLENLIDGNRQGLLLADMFYGSYSRNTFANNLETGIQLKNADNIEVSGNFVAGNGINGLNVQDSRAVIRGNQITDNAERGIGLISFGGLITENNLAGNGSYAMDLEDAADVTAPHNWWGVADPSRVIYDKRLDPSRGRVFYDKSSAVPFSFRWPLQEISSDTAWRGTIIVDKTVTVLNDAELKVMPKTTVEFAQGTGLLIKGRLLAKGTSAEKVTFTSQARKAAYDWDEIRLEYATGSEISHSIFSYATWGLHSHFTNLVISDSQFTDNFGGMRFRSGPVEVKRSIVSDNSIGIRAYMGNAAISENVISRNETGIFVREKGGGLAIKGNNIFDNSNYNIRVGDFNNEDVSAPDNWWGSADPLSTIFDGRAEPGIGNVLYEPYLKEPAKLDWSASP